jgi:hypothetical protein
MKAKEVKFNTTQFSETTTRYFVNEIQVTYEGYKQIKALIKITKRYENPQRYSVFYHRTRHCPLCLLNPLCRTCLYVEIFDYLCLNIGPKVPKKMSFITKARHDWILEEVLPKAIKFYRIGDDNAS